MGLFSTNKTYIGIDIGTSSIKVVELASKGNSVVLENYGFSEKRTTDKASRKLDIEYSAKAINLICRKAGIVSKNAVAALPIFSVFSSVINLANIPEKALDSAVRWEAKKIIPLSLEQMVLDWKKIDPDPGQERARAKEGGKNNNIKILITAAPRVLVNEFIEIFKLAQINLLNLETETFSLVRSLLGNDKSTIMLVDLGASTTDISIVHNSIPMLNRSIDIGGINITKIVSEKLNIDLEKAEQFKYDLGINSLGSKSNSMPEVILEVISPIINEINYAMNLFKNKDGLSVEKIVLSGGSALLSDLVGLLSKELNKTVIIGNPWHRVLYKPELKSILDEIGPRMSVAVGLAMRELG